MLCQQSIIMVVIAVDVNLLVDCDRGRGAARRHAGIVRLLDKFFGDEHFEDVAGEVDDDGSGRLFLRGIACQYVENFRLDDFLSGKFVMSHHIDQNDECAVFYLVPLVQRDVT